METKEQLLYFFLQGKISLSQYDYKFLANLQTMIHNDNRVTSNQADLFDRLVTKYNKQMTKQGIDGKTVIALPWKSMVVQSTPEYTGAVVSIVDDDITIRVPFNKTFITKFREIPSNTFQWNKERKLYTSPFRTTALKIAVTELYKHFSTVQFCENINQILEDLKQYDAQVWNPTLTSVNGKLMIAAMSSVLADVIGDMELNLEPMTLYKLSQLGIRVDPVLVDHDPFLKFAAEQTTYVEAAEAETLASMITGLGCSKIVFGRGLAHGMLGKQIRESMTKADITISNGFRTATSDDEQQMCVSVYDNPPSVTRIDKMIIVKDSRPIEVK